MPGVRVMLGALALLLMTACSAADPESESSPESAPSTTSHAAPPTTAVPPAKRLRAAKKALARATQGAYATVVVADGLDEPLYQERGRFNTPALILDLVRTYHLEYDPATGSQPYSVHMRGSKYTRFMRMDQWPDEFRGCWLDVSGDNLSDAAGVDYETGPSIAVPVALVLAARPAPGDQPIDGLELATDAGLALQTLGVNAQSLARIGPRLARVTAPATANFSSKNPTVIETLEIDGPAVLEALSDVELDATVRGLLPAATAEVTFSAATDPVERFRPLPEMLITDDTPEGQPCPANLD